MVGLEPLSLMGGVVREVWMVGKKLYAVIELRLARPYGKSLTTLLDFINVWDCRIIKLSTKRQITVIGIEWHKFRTIWGENPIAGFYEVPAGAEKFMASVHVVSIEEY
ncbi:MAG: hypothetical protein HC888_04585 [Candidatus Competibacteraceae bacterium]|nr:hypothetical protein [Candidatus Competibacteraceae bacterium]